MNTTPSWSSNKSIVFWTCALVSLILVQIFSFFFHEPWRDEVQAYLIGTSFKSPLHLIEILRFEAHPPILHLLYGLFSFLGAGSITLNIVSFLGSLMLLLGIYNWSKVLTDSVAVARVTCTIVFFTNFFLYEYSVISRGYGLGLGFGFLGFSFLLRDPQNLSYACRGLLFLSLSCLTSVHSAIFSIAALLSFLAFRIHKKEKHLGLYALFLIPLGLLYYIVRHHPDRAFGTVHVTVENLLANLWTFLKDPGSTFSFFAKTFTGVLHPHNWWAGKFDVNYTNLVGGMILLTILSVLIFSIVKGNQKYKVQLVTMALFLNASGLGFLFKFFYKGYHRHHLIVFIPILVYCAILLIDSLFRQKNLLVRGLSGFVLLLIFAPQWNGTFNSFRADYLYPFTHIQALAEALPENGVLYSRAQARLTPVLYHRPKFKLVSNGGLGRSFTYVIWDKKAGELVDEIGVIAKECSGGQVFLAERGSTADWSITKCIEQIWAYPRDVETTYFSEKMDLYSVDCDCIKAVL